MSNFQLTPHFLEKAQREGVSIAALWDIILNPKITYQSFTKQNGKRVPRICQKCGVQQQKWTGDSIAGKFCVVVNPCCQKAITFWLDQTETELRPDQVAAGVTGYRGRDGKWRK